MKEKGEKGQHDILSRLLQLSLVPLSATDSRILTAEHHEEYWGETVHF